MSSWTWVAKTLKNLRLANPAPGAATQIANSRLISSAQAQAVVVPPKPKKPLTPYFRFLGQVREDIKKQNPNLKMTELMRRIAQQWDKLDDAGKNNYISAYKKDMEGYASSLEKYKKSLTPEQQAVQEQLQMEKQLRKEKRDRKKRVRELGRPKKPLTGFLLFLKGQVPQGSSIQDYQKNAKELGAKWKTMSDKEKAPFLEQYEDAKLQYEKDLKKWEEKMIKQGNEDLVRLSQLHKKAVNKRR